MEFLSENNPPNTGRGEEARRRLMDAGLHSFSHSGYEGASTRQIAQVAGVNLSAITYHFGNKEGLYRAIVQELVAHLNESLIPMVRRVETSLVQTPPTHAEALELLQGLLGAFADNLLGIDDAIASQMVLIWIREQVTPTSAFEILFADMTLLMLRPCSLLVGKLRNIAPESPECRMQVFFLIGQILIFRIARIAALRVLGWETYNAERIAFIRALLHRNVAQLFTEKPPD